MKRFFILTCMITIIGCSSTGGIKIVSPSASEKQAKEEIRQAPVTKLGTSSQSPASDETKGQSDEATGGKKTEGIKIVSPSASEKEAKEEIRQAPVTNLETSSQPPASHEPAKEVPSAEAATSAGSAGAASPSVKSGHTLDALINLLEKKGVIHRDELMEEIEKLEKE
jgi:hypothetical protein